uniref:Cytochrome P450 n=1 Tax=Panagrolaimus sp. PS1159 TaxID=55785 RepID=A0AC35EZ35_9BILA
MLWLLVIFLILGLILFYELYWKRKDLPPGPLPLPLIGNLIQIYYYGLDKCFVQFQKDFGDFHTIWFGSTPVLSINDVPTIYDTMVKDGETYAGREDNPKAMDVIKGGYAGIVFTDGPLWKEQRRFAIKVLKEFGLGRNLMQERVLDEVSHFIKDMKDEIESGNKEIDFQNSLELAVGSIINAILLGYRFGKEKSDEFYTIKKYVSTFIHDLGDPLWKLMEYHPEIYRNIPIFNTVYQKLKRNANNLASFLRLQLYGGLQDMWVAGQETSAKMLTWLSLYLTAFPEIQAKLHKELDEQIGSSRLITLDDKNNLHYTNAVILETQRHCNLGAFNLIRRTLKPVEIRGYKLPVNTLITYASHTVNYDDRYFPNARKFDPERFIDENGKFYTRPEVMPFGLGKRACLGEGLARIELFLFTANIFNQFRLKQVPGKPVSLERIIGALASSKPFVVEVESRF